MSRTPFRKVAKPNFTKAQVAEWIAYQREHKISLNKLAAHLKIAYPTVQTYIAKYDLGELP